MKRTYQPHNTRRARTHGFRARMASAGGRKVINNRRRKGRARLATTITRSRPSPLSHPMAPASPLTSEGTAEPCGPIHGLPRAQRVRKRAEFVRIQGSPVRVACRHLLLLLALSVDEAGALLPARLGVVASRKVGPAVVRNRAKRLVREAFRLHPEVFPAGLDVVVIVRPGTHLLGLRDVAAEITGAAPTLAKRARELRLRGRR